MKCLDPDFALPFYGYRRLDEDGKPHDFVSSLSHFFESEKFRNTNEDLRHEVLISPTPVAARKIARKNRAEWRPDWMSIRGRVFASGLVMQMMQSKEAVRIARGAAAAAPSIPPGGLERIGGLPVRFVSGVAARVMAAAKDKAAIKLAVLSLRRATPTDLEDRLDALFSQQLPLTAAVYCGNDCVSTAERWCMRRAVPLKFVGSGSARFRAEEHVGLLRNTTSLILCAPSVRGEVSALVDQAKKARRKVIDLTRLPDDSLEH